MDGDTSQSSKPFESMSESGVSRLPEEKNFGVDEKESISSRILESKVLFAIFIISLLWTLAIFLVPLMIPGGTVAGLDGYANRVDYGHIWDTLPPHVGIVYLIGDAECHQISERTIYINGNQMPVCARDASIFLFLSVGLFVGMLSRRSYYLSKGVLSVFPKRFRDWVNNTIGAKWFGFILVFLCLLPLALDGGLQLFTGYESSNAVRFLTGLPAGLIAGLLVAVVIKSVRATREYRKEIDRERTAQPET